jgi:hypothetical protein
VKQYLKLKGVICQEINIPLQNNATVDILKQEALNPIEEIKVINHNLFINHRKIMEVNLCDQDIKSYKIY